MDSPILILVPIALSFSFLLLRLGRLPTISLLKRFRVQERLQSPPIAIFQKPASRSKSLLLSLGFLLGASAAWTWATFLPVVLLLLPAFALILEEMAEPRRLRELPAVLALIKQVRESVAAGNSLPEALGKLTLVLPDGPVKTAVKKSLQRLGDQLAPAESLAGLRGVNPYLDEFVSDSLRAGMRHRPALIIALDLLFERASRYWNRTGWLRTSQDRLQPYVHFARGFTIGGIVMGLALLFQPDTISIILILISILTAIALRFVLARPMARRAALAAVIILLLLSPTSFMPVVQVSSVQRTRQESALLAKSSQPVPNPQPEPVKLRSSNELPECVVSAGIAEGFVNLRTGPGMHHHVQDVIPEAEILAYLGQTGNFEEGEWRQVMAGGQVGWIYAPLCKTAVEFEDGRDEIRLSIPETLFSADLPVLDEQKPLISCRIATGYDAGRANLRSGPGMGFPVAATLSEETLLRYLEEAGDFYTTGIWFHVIAPNDVQGWIFSDLCEPGDRGNG